MNIETWALEAGGALRDAEKAATSAVARVSAAQGRGWVARLVADPNPDLAATRVAVVRERLADVRGRLLLQRAGL